MTEIQSSEFETLEVLPEDVTLVTAKTSHLYDPRVKLPVDKSPGKPYAMLKAAGRWTHGAVELERQTVDGVDYLLVVDGKQRIGALDLVNQERAAEGLPPIKARAFVSSGTKLGQFMRMFQANHGQRQNTPLEDAQMIQAMISIAMNEVPEDKPEARVQARREAEHHASVILGCSLDSIRNRMKLNDAAPEVKKALAAGKIAQSDALKILGGGKTIRPPEEQVKLLKATPEKTPGKRRTKKQAERKAASKGGVRGGNVRPSVRAMQKVLDVIGEGHADASALKFGCGLISQADYFKKLKLPEPGQRIRTKKAKPAKKGE